MKRHELKPPYAKLRPETSIHHNRTRQDDYAWLKPPDWLALLNEEVALPDDIRQYLEEENLYTAAMLKPLQSFQQTLLREMKGRVEDAEEELPEKDGPFEYYWRYASGSEHPVFARKPVDGGVEEILLDADQEAQGYDYFELGDFEVSPDHTQLAWSVDCRGAELAQLRVRNIHTGKDSAHVIDNVSSVTWIDNHCLMYACIDAEHRASQVFRHQPFLCRQGFEEIDTRSDSPSDSTRDTLVYQERDPAFEVAVGRMRSGRFVEIVSSTDGQDEVWLIDTSDPLSAPSLFQARSPGIEYSVDHQGEHFFIRTNAGDVKDFQIMTTTLMQTEIQHWRVWREPEPGVSVLSIDVYKNWVVWLEQCATLPRIRIQHHNGEISTIDFDEPAHELDYDLSPEYDCDTFRFTYESPTTPPQIWEYNLSSGSRRLLKVACIPSGHDPDDYRLSRLHATSADGTLVPITCLRHRLTPIDGTAPCVLEGYGSYGCSLLADFDSNRLSLVDRGTIYALAHVRGGEEKGHAWYEAAKGPLKHNTMDDFIACAEAMSQAQMCRADGVVALGRSAGGLLVGAVINQAPHLFKGVVADVPFVDSLCTLLDATHPLTPGEWEQWGNPIASPDAYDWIAGYSPYDNVTEQVYPSMLVTTALADPRVGYWEAAKWVAKIRRFDQGENPILLYTSTDGGHAGAAGRYGVLTEMAKEFAFIANLLGLSEQLESSQPDVVRTDT